MRWYAPFVNEDLWYPLTEPTSRGRGYRSAFGGTWPDLADAPRMLSGMIEIGLLDETLVITRSFGR